MQVKNSLLGAIFAHIKLVLLLKHDGSGMPSQVSAALMLAIAYMGLNLINNTHPDGIPMSTFIMVGFISQCYVLFLRNKLIGLIMFVSVICNTLTLLLTTFGIPTEQLGLLIVSEYILVTAAIVNVIKSETSAA